MQSVDLLWFESTGIVDEKIIKLPVIGGVSLRQFLILGATFVMSYILFKGMGEVSAWILFGIGLILVMKNEHVIPFEIKLSRIIMFYLKGLGIGTKSKKSKINRVKLNTHKLSIPQTFDDSIDGLPGSDVNEIKIRKIYEQIGIPLRLTLQLFDTMSRPVVKSNAKIILDGETLNTVKTDNYGYIGVNFTPQSAGEKLLQITVDGEIIHEEILDLIGLV
jgi:hypothetical protein